MMHQLPMKIATTLVVITVLVAGSISSAGCALICSGVHPLQAGDEHQPQSTSAVDHAVCGYEHGISQSKSSNIAARHGISCNPDCKTWLKLSAGQNVRKVAFKSSGLGLPKSTTFEQNVIAASPPSSASFSSAPPAKHFSSVLRV